MVDVERQVTVTVLQICEECLSKQALAFVGRWYYQANVASQDDPRYEFTIRIT